MGYAIGSRTSKEAYLYWLYVAPDIRGQNVGLRLLSQVCREMERRNVDSLTLVTHDHRNYYQRQGFKYQDSRELHGVKMDVMQLSLRKGNG